MNSPTIPLLELKNIAKSFGAVRALKGVSFDLHPGEIHALLGENGAGKSTLIKVVTGAHQPDSGTIAINGKTADRLTPASAHALGIAAIYQQPALFPDLSVTENIALALEKPSPMNLVGWRQRRIAPLNCSTGSGPKLILIAKCANSRCRNNNSSKSPAHWGRARAF